jgi:phosphoenolpyruvate-protein phosphotransferase (PTS system enzyme I)
MKRSAMILGEVASSGVARGPAFVCACIEPTTVPRRVINENETQKEMEKLDAAISEAEKELLDLQEKVQQKAGKQEATLFEAQILLLHDLSLREEISTRCLMEKINVEAALDEAIEKLTSLFVRLEDPYFRERAADLRDVGKRLLDILTRCQRSEIPNIRDGSVIVTSELLPSVTAQLDGQMIRG